jgi:hypothetical protein
MGRKRRKTDADLIAELRLFHHNEAADAFERAIARVKRMEEAIHADTDDTSRV